MVITKTYKENYNKLIAREKKGRTYIDSPDRTEAEIKKYLPAYMKVCDELSEMIDIYNRISDVKITDEEATEGFKL